MDIKFISNHLLNKYIKKILIKSVVILNVFTLSGCFWVTTKGEGDSIRNSIKQLKTDIENNKQQTEKSIQTLQSKLEDIENMLKQSTAMNANTGADLLNLQSDIAKMRGSLSEIEFNLDKVTKELAERQKTLDEKIKVVDSQMGLDPVLSPADIPSDNNSHWEAILKNMNDKEYGKARSFAKAYIERYSGDSKVDDAQMEVGIAYLYEKRYQKALGQLQMIIDNYPRSDVLGDVYYYMGESFLGLGDCMDAKIFWQKMIIQYPQAKTAQKARQGLINIQRNKRDLCKR